MREPRLAEPAARWSPDAGCAGDCANPRCKLSLLKRPRLGAQVARLRMLFHAGEEVDIEDLIKTASAKLGVDFACDASVNKKLDTVLFDAQFEFDP